MYKRSTLQLRRARQSPRERARLLLRGSRVTSRDSPEWRACSEATKEDMLT